MPDWKHTLQIKDLLATDKGPDFDYAAHSVAVAPECARRIRALKSLCEKDDVEKVGYLSDELEEVADLFEEIGKFTPEECFLDPLDEFNEAMSMLYDVGDRWHRIWIK